MSAATDQRSWPVVVVAGLALVLAAVLGAYLVFQPGAATSSDAVNHLAKLLFDLGVPFVMWTMQSIDHSVTAAKVELHRRGVIASARLRQPALALDDIACSQLARFIDRRLVDIG